MLKEEAVAEQNMRVALKDLSAQIAQDSLADKHVLAALSQWLGIPSFCPTCIAVVDPEEVAMKAAESEPINTSELHREWQRRRMGVSANDTQDFSHIKGFRPRPCLDAGVCHCRGPARLLGLFWPKLRQH